MSDIDFENIFSDLEEKDAREHEFMDILDSIVPSLEFQFHKQSGDVFAKNPSAGSSLDFPEGIWDKLRQREMVLADGKAGSLGVVKVEKMDGCLLCWQLKDGQTYCDQTVAELMQVAANFALMQIEFKLVQTENHQLTRQIGVMKTKHQELVEENHQQYLQNQKRERDYAKNLESEIALRTAELSKANDELIEASRLKSEFLANMSHELRTPMNAIIGFSDLLSETHLNQEQSEFAKTIKQSGDGLLALINDILDFAKIEAGKLDMAEEVFCLSDVVENVIAMFFQLAKEKNVRIHYDIGPGISPKLIGDGARLKQVLVNLTGNAMKFTAQGEVGVKVALLRETDDCCVLRFLVNDTGIGISPENQVAIFEKFTQADGSISRHYGGTGLGLAISCQLVELMGGNVYLCSEEGKGSIFGFTIRLGVDRTVEDIAEGAASAASASGAAASTAAHDQAQIDFQVLLVEDNLVNQKLATVLLKREGCCVDVAEDGLIALEKLKEKNYNLVLMDIQMPNMDGVQATQKIREIEGSSEKSQYKGLSGENGPVFIVGLSAHARKEDAEQAINAGMNDFLTKPIVRAKLVALLDALKSGGAVN